MNPNPLIRADAARPIKWVNLLFLSTTAIVAILAVPLYWYFEGFNGWLLALCFGYGTITAMSITGGYHRLLAHRSYEVPAPIRLLYLLFGAASFQGSALEWASDHRRHHRHVDTERDPHNINEGFFWAHIGWLLVHETPERRGKFETDLERDPLIRWQHRHYVPIAVLMGGGLPLLVGMAFGCPWGGFLFGGVLRTVFTNHTTFFINSLAHTLGKRTYSHKQTARDSVVMAFLAHGEGYHNFHHVFASDYRNGIRWYHWDPTKWLIRSLSFFGLARRLKVIPSTEIMRARMQEEQRVLLQKGVQPERVIALKERVEEAQKRWRAVREDYASMKRNVKQQFNEQFQWRKQQLQLKAEMRIARLEYKMARAQWGAFRRTFRALPAVALN